MKNILINGLLLKSEHSGVQYSIEYLVEALSSLESNCHKIEVLLSTKYEGTILESKSLGIKRVDISTFGRYSRIYLENFMLPSYLHKNKFHLYHSPGYVLPLFLKTNSIITIHDLIALDYPDLCQNETAIYYNLLLAKSINSARKIIAVSNTVKKDIINKFPKINEDKIHVIYPGIDSRFSRVTDQIFLDSVIFKLKLPDRFLLFVGNLEPKKNIDAIIKAYDELKKQTLTRHKLVIVGKPGWKYASIFNLVKSRNLQNDVLFLGYIDDAYLPAIYSLADMLIFPSFYEGFGIPVIEAMACGCPVIISNKGALPEISGGICLQVDPFSISEILNAIRILMQDSEQRELISNKGLKWAERYTWQTAADKTFQVYKEAIEQSDNFL
ncbi:glycosyltransferase family 4 protein [Pedobacter kyonggii]|uniref:Glycosyltransferase family 1 protein n=1 Tax=Pedobacter kyonggii TaxID=1926871 RepID=A0A4Q9HGD0_9SPHI|nr:glycosyltransferase family 1 protein [Pedobacter kyonggii]TBO44286.1 glycosyltransferase family 1 protein [Pedobacter kyonggii]